VPSHAAATPIEASLISFRRSEVSTATAATVRRSRTTAARRWTRRRTSVRR